MSAELMKPKFVRRPSVSQLSLHLMHGLLQILVVSPGIYARTFFKVLKKKKKHFGDLTNIFRFR